MTFMTLMIMMMTMMAMMNMMMTMMKIIIMLVLIDGVVEKPLCGGITPLSTFVIDRLPDYYPSSPKVSK